MSKKVSRRSFVKFAGVTGVGVAGAVLPERLRAKAATPTTPVELTETAATASLPASSPATLPSPPYVFFTNAERGFIEAAINRLIPADEVGPGALELDVAHYIDHQLGGSFGNGERMYLEGPFEQGLPTQGYQLPLRPSEVYRIAIADIDNYCRTNFGGKAFAELAARDQDNVLTGLETGKIVLANLPAELFFGLLLQNTIEGYFADPMYHGNKDMGSWTMLGFPGAQANFRADVGKQERVAYTPISLAQVLTQSTSQAKQ